MCYNCGCELPEDDMGHSDNITNETFRHVAEHEGVTFEEIQHMVLDNLKKELAGEEVKWDSHLTEMFEKAAQASQQNVSDAKKFTYELLKKELG
ncbi:hypothetical protein HYZ78_04350 [Candidatus Microgenomates bacterium]|nr:hypothetical protein [Candidatus Microgenomates bacterium]